MLPCINNRRSIRKYTGQPVSKNLIEMIVEAGSLAPSGKNRQPWKYIVYTGVAKEKVLAAMESGLKREQSGEAILPESAEGLPDAFNTLKIMREAPVLIMILNTNGSSPYEPISTDRRLSEICDSLSIGASVQNMLLTAGELGLGTLWIGNTCFAYPEIATEVGCDAQIAGAISLGYPAEKPQARPRKPLSGILEYRE